MGILQYVSYGFYGFAILTPVVFILLFLLAIVGGINVLEGTVFAVVFGIIALLATMAFAIGGYLVGRIASGRGGEKTSATPE